MYDHFIHITQEGSARAEIIIISYVNKKKSILERFKYLEYMRILSLLFA